MLRIGFPLSSRIFCANASKFRVNSALKKRICYVSAWNSDFSKRQYSTMRSKFYEGYTSAPKEWTESEVKESVFKAIRSFDRYPKDVELKMETDLLKDLGLDSLDHVEMIMAVEDEFELEKEIPDDFAQKLTTPQAIFEYVCETEEVWKK